eukprot:m.259558 g.259558  ORF g.259558 m.259558 type:complete len:600 (-) comp38260_c0_seq1:127-1926(-)
MAQSIVKEFAGSGSLEEQSQALLSAYLNGSVTIEDLMGPLTAAKTVEPVNSTMTIRPGGHAVVPVAPSVDVLPADEHNVKLVANVHPPDYVNAQPADHYDLVVIGAGVAGLLSVIMGKALGKRCAMIEKHYMGGDCLNVGCFPSKVMIASARRMHDILNSADLGIDVDPANVKVDFGKVMERVRMLRAKIAPNDSVERYKKDFCEEIFLGNASFAGENKVHVAGGKHGDRVLTFDKAMIATGASPKIPDIPGLVATPHLTNLNFFNLTDLPARVTVIGAGPIGMELAQALCRLGAKVTVLEYGSHFLPREDPDASEIVRQALIKDGVDLRYNVRFENVESDGGNVTSAPFGISKVSVNIEGKKETFECEAILNATGRVPNVHNIGLDKVGVEFDSNQGVVVDDYYMTTNKDIYATGDVASPFKFTHAADFMARIAIRNMFLGDKTTSNRIVVPWCTYVSPEVAHVGMYETEMKQKNIAHETYIKTFEHLDRVICDGSGEGFVKIHVKAGTDKILGATIVAPHAGDMISEITTCIQHDIGVGKLAGVIHPYPTTQEAVRICAGQYNKHYKTDVIKGALSLIGDHYAKSQSDQPTKRAKTE